MATRHNKNNHPVATSKQVVNEFDLGYLGVGTDFPRTTIGTAI